MTTSIILFSSGRRHGNTGRLADCIAARLGAELVNLDDKRITPFDYGHGNRDDDFEPLMQHVLEFDHLILASPVYWYAVTPTLKAFIDRITDYLDLPDLRPAGRRLRGKQCHVLCTSNHDRPDTAFLGMLQQTIAYLGMRFGNCLHVNCRNGYDRGLSFEALDAFITGIKPRSALRHNHLINLTRKST